MITLRSVVTVGEHLVDMERCRLRLERSDTDAILEALNQRAELLSVCERMLPIVEQKGKGAAAAEVYEAGRVAIARARGE